MSLNVTGAPQTLALLQALSQRSSTPPAAAGTALSTQSAAADGSSASAQHALVGPAVSVQHMFTAADSVAQALTAADVADAAGQGVVSLLHQMHAIAGEAADPAASASNRASLDQQFQARAAQVAPTLSAATVHGTNLVDGSTRSGAKLTLADGSAASLTPLDLTLGGSTLSLAAHASVSTATAAASVQARVGTALAGASAALSTLQTQADQIGAHAGFVQTLASSSPASTAMDGDGARLMALQVSQQLSAQSTGVANTSPSSILSLFRS